jgi:hypothetical protein
VEQVLQANIEAGYARFLGLVAQSRHKTPAQVDAMAQGRVWDGGTARQKGLVDQFGGLDDALAWAAGQAGLKAGAGAEFMGADTGALAQMVRQLQQQQDDSSEEQDGDSADWAGMIAQGQRRQWPRPWPGWTGCWGRRARRPIAGLCEAAAGACPRRRADGRICAGRCWRAWRCGGAGAGLDFCAPFACNASKAHP